MEANSDIYHDSARAMGTRLDVVLTGIPKAAAAALCESLFDRIRKLESVLSRFQPDGETGRLNRLAHASPVAVGPFLWDVLDRCRDFHRGTGGAFDIALSPLLAFHRLPANERTEAALREARAASGMDRIEFDSARRTVRFARPLTGIDFGSVGKGLALDDIRPALVAAGVENALVSFGESSVLALGRHPYGDCWEIGIRHPVTDEAVRVMRLRDAALSVSGLRRTTREGVPELQGHIVEPATGRLVDRPSTVAVKCGSAFEAEALSTALLASGEDKPAFLNRFPRVESLLVDAESSESALLP